MRHASFAILFMKSPCVHKPSSASTYVYYNFVLLGFRPIAPCLHEEFGNITRMMSRGREGEEDVKVDLSSRKRGKTQTVLEQPEGPQNGMSGAGKVENKRKSKHHVRQIAASEQTQPSKRSERRGRGKEDSRGQKRFRWQRQRERERTWRI